MKRIADILEGALKFLVIIMLSALTIIVVVGIAARYVFLVSIPWTEEISRYLMIWTSFLGLGVAYRKRELIAVKLLTDLLPKKMFRIALFVSDILCSIFLVVVVYYGVKLCVQNSDQVSAAARIPTSIVYAAIPVGGVIYLFFSLESILDFFKGRKRVPV
jgi:TRAP-type C4-dicarboxylate transport system permease small subunit